MKISLHRQTLIFLFSVNSFFAVGQKDDYTQESRFKPFTLLIIIPDSAYVDNSLKSLVDSVESGYKESYYSHIETMELFKQFEPEEKRRETELTIQRAKWMEMEVHDFKYYQAIGMLSCPELQSLFNEYPWEKPSLRCQLTETKDLFTYDLNKLTDQYGYDYIIAYKNIRAEKYGNNFRLRLTTSIYSKRDKRIINETETYGHTGHYQNKYGETLNCDNDLQCLLETGVKSSTELIFKVISKRQKK